MAAYFVRYSCCLHNDPKAYVITLPWSETRVCPTTKEVWDKLRKDSLLLARLFGDDLACYSYDEIAEHPDHYNDLLHRTHELVNMEIDFYSEEEPEESFFTKCQKFLSKVRSK